MGVSVDDFAWPTRDPGTVNKSTAVGGGGERRGDRGRTAGRSGPELYLHRFGKRVPVGGKRASQCHAADRLPGAVPLLRERVDFPSRRTSLKSIVRYGYSPWSGMTTVKVVPLPAGLEMPRRPGRASTRSLSPIRPEPAPATAPPMPSSLMLTRSSTSTASADIVTSDASACLAAFVRASATT